MKILFTTFKNNYNNHNKALKSKDKMIITKVKQLLSKDNPEAIATNNKGNQYSTEQ